MKIREAGASPSSGSQLERITVNLTPRAAQALAASIARTGDSKTDTVIRAITVYAWVEQALADGGTVYLRRDGSEENERILLL